MASNSSVLILGATGGIGGEVARQLRDAGWDVRALQRRASNLIEQRDGITWVRGDALSAHDVAKAAQGCSVIVHAVNPPGYRRWSELVLPMLDNTIAAACAVGATIVLPGTIYNFGPDSFPVLHEESPQHPVTRKGAIRVEMERRLSAGDASLDEPWRVDDVDDRRRGDGMSAPLEQRPDAEVEARELSLVLERELRAFRATLTGRDAEIFNGRVVNEEEEATTLAEFAERFGVSRERVRQLEGRLKQRLRTHLRASLGDTVPAAA